MSNRTDMLLNTIDNLKEENSKLKIERYQAGIKTRLGLKRLNNLIEENEALKKRIRELSPPTYISKGGSK